MGHEINIVAVTRALRLYLAPSAPETEMHKLLLFASLMHCNEPEEPRNSSTNFPKLRK